MIEIKCKDKNYVLVREKKTKKDGTSYDGFYHFVPISKLIENKYHKTDKLGVESVLTPFDEIPIAKNNKPYILTIRKNKAGDELFPVMYTNRTPEEIKLWRQNKRLVAKAKRQRKQKTNSVKQLKLAKKEKRELYNTNKPLILKLKKLKIKINGFESKIKRYNKKMK